MFFGRPESFAHVAKLVAILQFEYDVLSLIDKNKSNNMLGRFFDGPGLLEGYGLSSNCLEQLD